MVKFITLLFLLLPILSISQNNEYKTAYQHYINGEYEKAVLIYKDSPKSSLSSYYSPYYMSLLYLKKYNDAKKLVNIMLRKQKQNLGYQVDLVIVLDKVGNQREATKKHLEIIKNINGTYNQSRYLSNKYINHEMYKKALSIYEKSEKINDKDNFNIYKAELYSYLDDNNMMIKEYINSIIKYPKTKKQVISKIQKFLDNDGIENFENYKVTKNQLLISINKNINNLQLTEMLIWLYMQSADFKMALVQAKALDKRGKNDGKIVYDIAESLLDYQEYDIAIDAFNYILSLNKKSQVYISSCINKLYAMTKLISSKKDLYKIDDLYLQFINELGKNNKTVLLLSNYANFKAFNLNQLNEASLLLEDAININQISSTDLAECKLEYADIQLLLGNIWESLLFYSQVEKDFRESPIGHEAKLRRAKIAYFQGDFSWAQAQLQVLKASTSKLIANDAMKLSLLITDNYNLDTAEYPMKTFAKADLFIFQNNFTQAFLKFDSILNNFPGHSLEDEIYMRKADIYCESDSFNLALEMYEKVIQDYSFDILADDAIFKKAKLFEKINDLENAKNLYEKLILEYSNSIYTAEARIRFRSIRGDKMNSYK